MPYEENSHLGEEYITVRALLTVVSQRICGRASTVWEVIKKKDFERGHYDLHRSPVRISDFAWFAIIEAIGRFLY
jgi:hypothetical protein